MEDITPSNNKVLSVLHKLEDWLLVSVAAAIIVFSSTQIILRNVFESGVVWISPMMGLLVLWVGLLGALLATRQQAHIKINVLYKYLPEQYKPVALIVSNLFSATILFILGYYCIEFVKLDWDTDAKAFANVPMWVAQIIVPISFYLMGLRFLAYSVLISVVLLKRLR